MPGERRSRLFFAIVVAGASMGGAGCYLKHERAPVPDAAADSSVDSSRDAPLFDTRPRDSSTDSGADSDAGCTIEMCYCVDLDEHPECIPCGAPCIL